MMSNAFKAGKAAALSLFVMVASVLPDRAGAADLDLMSAPPPVTYGVDCGGPEVKTFPSVWLGHFTGGDSVYPGPGSQILLDWHDEKLCFPTRRTCDRWVSGMRRGFHRPAGYFTCLTIR